MSEDAGCICKGNWRAIVKEAEPLLDKKFKNSQGLTFRFFGIVHGSDDYYYGMIGCNEAAGKLMLLSCVGSISGHGYELIED